MLLTEANAYERYCAMPIKNFREFCHGDECMAWRWADPKERGEARRGYCGLAGPPLFAILRHPAGRVPSIQADAEPNPGG